MNDKMLKMMEKKKKSSREMSDPEREAKMNVVKDMRQMASSAMADGLKGLKKVSVAADSKEGLQEGLDKAKQILSSKEHDGMVEDAESCEPTEEKDEDMMPNEEHPDSEENEEDESSEDEDMSPEEASMSHEDIDAKIKKLMELKNKMK